MLEINQEIQQGRYRIINRFGQGKANLFYEVYDKTLAQNVLLKEISDKSGEAASSAQIEGRNDNFDGEAKFLSEIKHSGFLQVLNYFSDGDACYLVIEAINGKNIGELIKNSSKLVSPANVLDWGKQMLDALDYLHKKTPPVVYFNLKPSNLFLTPDQNIKLLATGIADRNGLNGEIKKQAYDNANLNYSPLEVIWKKLDTASQRVILNGFDENSEEFLIK